MIELRSKFLDIKKDTSILNKDAPHGLIVCLDNEIRSTLVYDILLNLSSTNSDLPLVYFDIEIDRYKFFSTKVVNFEQYYNNTIYHHEYKNDFDIYGVVTQLEDFLLKRNQEAKAGVNKTSLIVIENLARYFMHIKLKKIIDTLCESGKFSSTHLLATISHESQIDQNWSGVFDIKLIS